MKDFKTNQVREGYFLLEEFKCGKVDHFLSSHLFRTARINEDNDKIYHRKEKLSPEQISLLFTSLRSYIPPPIIAKIDELDKVSNDGSLRELCVLFVKVRHGEE